MERPVRSMHMDIVGQRSLDGNVCRVTIAANEKVRQPPELDFDGLSTENYSRNPVVMWAHDAVGRSPSGGLPIGRTLDLTKKPNGDIVADFEFLSDDPFAQRVKNAWDQGFLKAASISWVPLESVPVEGGRWRDTRADLLEWSIVSVPADPDALRESHRRLMDAFLGESASGDVSGDSGVGERPLPGSERQLQATTGRDGVEAGRVPPEGTPLLSPGYYDDLASALTLLRKAAEAVLRSSTDGREPSDSDMEEIRALTGAVKSAVLGSNSYQNYQRGGGALFPNP